jgi:hypothetical protein
MLSILVDREKGSRLTEVAALFPLIVTHRNSSASAGAIGFDRVSPLEVHRITANLSTHDSLPNHE